jgi:hypothetical protein
VTILVCHWVVLVECVCVWSFCVERSNDHHSCHSTPIGQSSCPPPPLSLSLSLSFADTCTPHFQFSCMHHCHQHSLISHSLASLSLPLLRVSTNLPPPPPPPLPRVGARSDFPSFAHHNLFVSNPQQPQVIQLLKLGADPTVLNNAGVSAASK